MKHLNKFTTGESSHAQPLDDDDIESDEKEFDASGNEAQESSDQVPDVDIETETTATDTDESTSVPRQRYGKEQIF